MQKFCDTCGWIGSICLGLCGLPEALRALTASDYSISVLFVGLWFMGEALVLVPAVFVIKKPYVIVNISLNLTFIGIILCRGLGIIGEIV